MEKKFVFLESKKIDFNSKDYITEYIEYNCELKDNDEERVKTDFRYRIMNQELANATDETVEERVKVAEELGNIFADILAGDIINFKSLAIYVSNNDKINKENLTTFVREFFDLFSFDEANKQVFSIAEMSTMLRYSPLTNEKAKMEEIIDSASPNTAVLSAYECESKLTSKNNESKALIKK